MQVAEPLVLTRCACAVLVADVVGFSRLMEEDEEDTYKRLHGLRLEVIGPGVVRHGGHVVKETGDGFIASFDSAGAALTCALAIGDEIARRGSSAAAGRAIRLRMGVHVGDVIREEHDIYGETVNIAARLQALAEPDGIIASAAVLAAASTVATGPVRDLGELHLKNIKRPVPAFALRAHAAGPVEADAAAPDARPSIAVMPFAVGDEGAADGYLAGGVIEDIIRSLSSLKELVVVSRGSSLTAGGRATDPVAFGRQLGVRYVLHGGISRSLGKLRIQTILSDTETSAVLAAERFDGAFGDLFALQDRISLHIVAILAPQVREAELKRALRKHPESMTAYDYVLQALDLLYRMDFEAFSRARGLLQQSMAHEPGYAPAYSCAAQWHTFRVGQGWSSDPEADGREAAALAAAAIELDRYDANALAIYGHALSFLMKDYVGGATYLDRATTAGPSSALAWTLSSCTSAYLGEAAAAVDKAKHALRLTPLDPLDYFYLHNLGMACYAADDYEQAVRLGYRAMGRRDSFRANLRVLAASLVALGRIAEAEAVARRLLVVQPGFTLRAYARICPFENPDRRQRFLERLARAGLPG
jgi:class 3 adenylate cyclase/tetratricopeptide (TPR) repeat protein